MFDHAHGLRERGSDSCPDEEGIKTAHRLAQNPAEPGSDSCPDEEGIKTHFVAQVPPTGGVRTLALMKKGLRPQNRVAFCAE